MQMYLVARLIKIKHWYIALQLGSYSQQYEHCSRYEQNQRNFLRSVLLKDLGVSVHRAHCRKPQNRTMLLGFFA